MPFKNQHEILPRWHLLLMNLICGMGSHRMGLFEEKEMHGGSSVYEITYYVKVTLLQNPCYIIPLSGINYFGTFRQQVL